MKKVIFLHGFFASGSCPLALTLKEELEGRAEVLTPDLPMNPIEALNFIHDLCDKVQPDLLVGNSCGSFYAQILAPIVGVPALLGNPHFEMSKFLSERKGEHQYKSPRRDGKQDFVIDDALIEAFKKVEAQQFNYTSLYYKGRVWGLFGEQDTLAQYEPVFQRHYTVSHHFPGAHTPTVEEAKTWYVPMVEKMLLTFTKPEARYFRHFKGNLYRFERTAFDSETQERMVVYQQQYGEHNYWVRPEKMFFEHVTRDGKTFNRFLETEICTNMCSHLQKKLFEPDGVYYPIWLALQEYSTLTAVVRSRQLHIYRNGKKVLVLAGKSQPKVIREDVINSLIKVQ